MRLTRTVDPAELPVSLDEAKQYCRVEHDDENLLIESLIVAAVDYLDGPSGILGRAIIEQQWLLELDAWPSRLALPIEPVSTVTVQYLDKLGAETDVPENQLVIIDAPSARTGVGRRISGAGAQRHALPGEDYDHSGVRCRSEGTQRHQGGHQDDGRPLV